MTNKSTMSDKKKSLLAYRKKILEEIQYYERSIKDFQSDQQMHIVYYEDDNSSDSEEEFPTTIDAGPTVLQLKQQQEMLKTCLNATQELTGLTVLQSEVNTLVDDPKLEGERPVTELGTWKDVTAECRVDLIPFTITFYMHTPSRKFGQTSYRGLRVVPVKYSHEMELAKSVLHTLKLPSDAVEVIRSYAAGYRSRRTTLSRLANKYGNSLFMEPHPEGGFILKCADLLEVSWRLENKWSPVAPFHHRMKFDLEYMDESYIKIITQAHKQLLDPSIQTDERTLLLAKIITTCLEAKGTTEQESDLESKTTDKENIDNQKNDNEVMAPPKSLPKKSKKQSGGEKRSIDENTDGGSSKRMKTNENIDNSDENKTEIEDGNADKLERDAQSVAPPKNVNKKTKAISNTQKQTDEAGPSKKINDTAKDGNKNNAAKTKLDKDSNKIGNQKERDSKIGSKIPQKSKNSPTNSANVENNGPKMQKSDEKNEATKIKTKINDIPNQGGKKITKVASDKNIVTKNVIKPTNRGEKENLGQNTNKVTEKKSEVASTKNKDQPNSNIKTKLIKKSTIGDKENLKKNVNTVTEKNAKIARVKNVKDQVNSNSKITNVKSAIGVANKKSNVAITKKVKEPNAVRIPAKVSVINLGANKEKDNNINSQSNTKIPTNLKMKPKNIVKKP